MKEEQEHKEFAGMLAKPEGEMGKKVAENLNKSNLNMIQWTIDGLSLEDGDKVLEVGFGNGDHIKEILNQRNNIDYTGIEIAETMIKEASKRYPKEIESKQVEIVLASSENIPFSENSFDKVITANTLYFWDNPEVHLKQMYKVMKPGGLLSLSIRSKKFLTPLPFVKYGFTLYSQEEAEKLLEKSGFKVVKSNYKKEPLQNFEGVVSEPDTIIIVATK